MFWYGRLADEYMLSRATVGVVVLAHGIRRPALLSGCAAGFEVALALLLDGVAGVGLFCLFSGRC